jgi:prevent-host-death family protein
VKRKFSIAEAKNKLPSIIHQVEKGPSVTLTRRGEPVAVLLSVREYERTGQKSRGFWNAVMAFRQVVRDEAVEITDSDFVGLRNSVVGREVHLEV